MRREAGVGVPAGTFIWAGVIVWLALASLAIGVHVLARSRWLRLKSLAANLVRDPALTAPWGDPVGGPEEDLYFLAEHLATARLERDDARLLGHALLQVGSHYTLLCMLDGRLIDANAPFLARVGLAPEDLRQQGKERLAEALDMEPLLDLARRSLRDDVALTGIESELRVGSEIRPVVISLRALSLRSGPALVMVMNDKSHAAQLERQIDQFTDALELMVDQRVARITAGKASAEEALASAGLAVFVFGPDGRTETLNRIARRLTGRTSFTLDSIDEVAASLAPDAASVQRITAWFWADEDTTESMVVDRVSSGERPYILLRGLTGAPRQVDRRILVMIPFPESLPAPASSAPGVAYSSDLVLKRLETLAATLDPGEYSAAARPYIAVISEAVRRLEAGAAISGDGAPADPAPVSR